ncbi:D-aspartate oxidase, putative [Pediculus humanus corporis]|uniref:D-aspartate oxidase, putative n=1 Tax=Pediculus humanus subsp. corporis TaxID=121224 RepID=E0VYW7_PEDHC|nr:D-aspartate oxidase, putative [Pediculus humanus corporis]EEB18573.1 D-aspartate oxidase, putative [Pediculus humanus corporis]
MSGIKFGVLGAGVVGMTTCLELQSQYPNSDIYLIADKFNEETTSDGAAGIFRPGTSFSIYPEEYTKFVIEESYCYYDEIRKKINPFVSGVSEISGYIFSSNNSSLVKNDLIDKIVPVYRSANDDELSICPGKWLYGSYFVTLLTECRKFLPWTLLRFKENGGRVIMKKINSINDLGEYKFDLIFNCSGFGAKYIFNDRKLVPIRGQVIKVKAPWLKNFFYADYDTYVIPGLENVTLGGCRHYDSYDLNINPYDSAAIWNRCVQLVPGLKNVKIEKEWVGLRPHRDPVRIQIESVKLNDKYLKCVHNYGHGGYGVTTAPGSAKLAVKLATDYFKKNSKM